MNDLLHRIAALASRQVRVLDVGLDLDGTFGIWFHEAYYHGCVAIGEVDPAVYPRIDAQHWDFYEALGHDLPQFLGNCDRLADLGLLWDRPLIPGAATAWDAILDAGHRVHVITDRAFGSHPIASEVATRMWLNRYGRRYHSLTFTRHKSDVVTDAMLEDKIENYDELEDTQASRCWLINRPWNLVEGGDDRRRVDYHDEFVLEVLTMGAQPDEAAA
jgi:hypothetical protein